MRQLERATRLPVSMLGAADQEIVGSPVEFSSVLPYFAGYVQDDIKATTRLTRNVGLRLRYDVETPPVEVYNLVWSKYSSGAGIISKQAGEALAAMDISATRFQRRGREEERISLSP
jgi:hypothetical protein